MPYVFGAATGDDATFTLPFAVGGTGFTFVSGWWRPTTLTGTRKYWSANSTGVFGAEIDAATQNVRVKVDNATTDGEWTVFGAAILNEWTFLAIAASINAATPAVEWKVWTGKADAQPIERGLTSAVAMAGAITGSTAFYVGNAGTGTKAFQGHIANVTVIGETIAGPNSISGIETFGAAWTPEAEYHMLHKLVTPAWEGDYGRLARLRPGTSDQFGFYHWTGEQPGTIVESPYGRIAATVTGSTISTLSSPRPMLAPLDHLIGKANSSS